MSAVGDQSGDNEGAFSRILPIAGHLAVWWTAIAALIFAGLYPYVSGFYAQMGLTTTQVGVDPFDIAQKALLAIFVFTRGLIFLYIPLFVLGISYLPAGHFRAFCWLFVICTVPITLWMVAGDPRLVGLTILSWFLAALLPFAKGAGFWGLSIWIRGLPKPFFVLAAIALLSVTAVVGRSLGKSDATEMLNSPVNRVPHKTIMERLVGMGPGWVPQLLAVSDDSPAADHSGHFVRLLGDADGRAVIFDLKDCTVIQLELSETSFSGANTVGMGIESFDGYRPLGCSFSGDAFVISDLME